MSEYSLPIETGIPNLFGDGFSFPVSHTPPDILDLILREYPQTGRYYRIQTRYPSTTPVTITICSPSRNPGKITYGNSSVTFYHQPRIPDYSPLRLSSKTGNNDYVFHMKRPKLTLNWKPTELVTILDFQFKSGKINTMRFVVTQKKKTTYRMELPKSWVPRGYWKQGIPAHSTRHWNRGASFIIPVENTVLVELVPGLKFPVPVGTVDIRDLIEVISEDVAEDAISAGVHPLRVVKGEFEYQGWGR